MKISYVLGLHYCTWHGMSWTCSEAELNLSILGNSVTKCTTQCQKALSQLQVIGPPIEYYPKIQAKRIHTWLRTKMGQFWSGLLWALIWMLSNIYGKSWDMQTEEGILQTLDSWRQTTIWQVQKYHWGLQKCLICNDCLQSSCSKILGLVSHRLTTSFSGAILFFWIKIKVWFHGINKYEFQLLLPCSISKKKKNVGSYFFSWKGTNRFLHDCVGRTLQGV